MDLHMVQRVQAKEPTENRHSLESLTSEPTQDALSRVRNHGSLSLSGTRMHTETRDEACRAGIPPSRSGSSVLQTSKRVGGSHLQA